MTQIPKEAWGLDQQHLAVLAAIGSAKGALPCQIQEAGVDVSEDAFQTLEKLDLIQRKPSKHQKNDPPYKLSGNGRSLLWHKQWRYTGYPVFAQHAVVRWALNLAYVFGDINTRFLTRDLGLTPDDVEPHLKRMAEHNMIVRDGDVATLLDKSQWKARLN